jgi:short-subunit dehydrogenase
MKKILITGASSGVGKALVHHLKDSYFIIVVARRLEQLQMEFGKHAHIEIHSLDLTDPAELISFLDDLTTRHPDIDFLINNAGILKPGEIAEMNFQVIRESFALNTFAPVMIMQKLLPGMIGQNFGRIINITSGAPLNCFQGFGAYSSSKAALNAFTLTAANETRKYNIKINLMSPGPVKTEMTPQAEMDPSVCFPTVDYLLNLDENGYTGGFFWLGYKVPLMPDLEGVQWLKGIGNEKLTRIL